MFPRWKNSVSVTYSNQVAIRVSKFLKEREVRQRRLHRWGNPREIGNEKLRVAVVGCGAIGSRHAQAVVQSRHAQLTAACDVQPERAERVAAPVRANVYADVEALLSAEPFDVVTVATPEHLHLAPVVKSIEAGCHVFCEKPMASTLADAQRMADVAAQHKRHLAIDYKPSIRLRVFESEKNSVRKEQSAIFGMS